jgi:hypothetical protein
MRVLICGSRNYKDRNQIRTILNQLPSDCIIIQGGASGADAIAAHVATCQGKEVITFKADWKTHGKAAGPIRNQQMLDEGKPDLVIAFHEDIESSRGTKDMVRRSREAGLPVLLYK